MNLRTKKLLANTGLVVAIVMLYVIVFTAPSMKYSQTTLWLFAIIFAAASLGSARLLYFVKKEEFYAW